MKSRRDLLKNIGLGVSVCTLGGLQAEKIHSLKDWLLFDKGSAPWWLIAPLKVGDNLGRGWSLFKLGDVQRGASILHLVHKDGRQARAHICAHLGSPKGLAYTRFLDVLLMDGGTGDKQTEEDVGCVLLEVVARIRKNERNIPENIEGLTELQCHEDRMNLYGAETLV